MTPNPTSMRLTTEELELLDALAEVRSTSTGVRHSRVDIIRWLLKRVEPSTEIGPQFARHRTAYQTVFPERNTQ